MMYCLGFLRFNEKTEFLGLRRNDWYLVSNLIMGLREKNKGNQPRLRVKQYRKNVEKSTTRTLLVDKSPT